MQGSSIDAGGDGVKGDVGQHADRVALGKDIHQMIVSLGESGFRADADTWRKLMDIVLGDGVAWDGVMQDLRRLRESVQSLTNKVATLEQKVSDLKAEMDERHETSNQMIWMLRLVLALVVVMAAVYVSQAWG
jgi:hypothetical protein